MNEMHTYVSSLFVTPNPGILQGARRYTNREAGVIHHGVAGHGPLFPGNRESVVDIAAPGFAISPPFDVGAWGVFTCRDFGSSFRVNGDTDLVASQPCHGLGDDVIMFVDAFFIRGALDATHKGRSIRSELVPSVVVDAVVQY
jgi:hypothetical protein